MFMTKGKKKSEQSDFIRTPDKKSPYLERQFSEPVMARDRVDGGGFSRSSSSPCKPVPEDEGEPFDPELLPDGACISPMKIAPSSKEETSHSAVRDAEVSLHVLIFLIMIINLNFER